MRKPSTRLSGFTLIELMVATLLMLTLGLMLIASLNATVKIVTTGTTQGDAWVRGQTILSRVEDDLVQLHTSKEKGRLVSGIDPYGRPFLVFTRALPEERTSAAGIFSAKRPAGTGESDSFDKVWRGSSAEDSYRAMGGVAAVAYVFEPSDEGIVLYRGIVAPIGQSRGATYSRSGGGGGVGSNDLFDDLEGWHFAARQGQNAYPAQLGFASTYDVFGEDVLYLGVEFIDKQLSSAIDQTIWRHYWESSAESALPGDIANSGNWPAPRRSAASERAVKNGRIALRTSEGKTPAILREVPRELNMGFPQHARITVTIARRDPLRASTTLASAISESATQIELEDDKNFKVSITNPEQNLVRIGSEWVQFETRNGTTLVNCTRGMRGTRPINHNAGESVKQGMSFVKVIKLPAGN